MWIELHDTLPDNPKLIKLADVTQLPDTQVIGMLACLWTWALTNRPDGVLSELDWRAVERAARWSGKSKAFFDALVTVGFIDAETNGASLHDWLKYTGKLAERREKDRARKTPGKAQERARDSADDPRDFQQNSIESPSDIRRNSKGNPYATVPNRTKPIDDDDDRTRTREDTEVLPTEEAHLVCKHFEQTFGSGAPACIEKEIDNHLHNGLEVPLICEAIDQAAKHGVPNWAYANRILVTCTNKDVKTLSEYRASEGVRNATKTASRARAAPKLMDFEKDFANQRTYSKEYYANMVSSLESLDNL